MPEAVLSDDIMDGYRIARAVAVRYPDGLLRSIEYEERDERTAAVSDALNGADSWWYMNEPQKLEALALDAGRLTMRRNAVLRAWAGETAVDRARENAELRVELATARHIAQRAVDALADAARSKRARTLAATLQSELTGQETKD